ncbi:MAG: Tex family protein [Chitinophagales bacterium]|nr:Tex family protein [Chitinophagales bacterium]
MQELIALVAKETLIDQQQVQATVALLDEGATIPFIARYRKEKTGSLDEVEIGWIKNCIQKYRDIEKRKESILKSIEDQGKLTDELKEKIISCYDAAILEDIYLPYKPKRKTKASIAKEKGLEPLATLIYKQQERDVITKATDFITENVANAEEALQGARDIIAEWINEDMIVRALVRRQFEQHAVIKTKVAFGKEQDKEAQKFRDYFEWEEPLKHCPSHRLLAMRRGEEEGFLYLHIAPDEEQMLDILQHRVVKGNNAASEQVAIALKDAYKRLMKFSIEFEFRNSSKEKADKEAIDVFVKNLRQLLLAPVLGQKPILALDPGFVTGCKLVCLDDKGTLLEDSVIYPHPPQNKTREAEEIVRGLMYKYGIQTIAVGNGTAGRETEDWLQKIKWERKPLIFSVNESGASIYSASEVAREEFPDKDVTVRGAVSIGRRLMDPLAELVKIDPKSIGVGQYQHDVNQYLLKQSLDETVVSCVSQVGVNLNTASKHLLMYVAGLGQSTAENIVQYRTQNGGFKNRKELLNVNRLGDKIFEQAAGFLRITDAENPLDNSAVHPERYALVERMAKDQNISIGDLLKNKDLRKKINIKNYVSNEVGLPTLEDIMKELEKPGRDPREEIQAFEFDPTIKTIHDLHIGMVVPGLVTNITNFGCFVNIGVKQDGLIHISELANKFIKDPNEAVKLQQAIKVKIIEVDITRNRINLSKKQAE